MFDIEKTKKEIVSYLHNINAIKVILFWSYAYGVPNEDSDLDICVVKEKIISKIKEKREIRELLKNIKISKDILMVDLLLYKAIVDFNSAKALFDMFEKGEIEIDIENLIFMEKNITLSL